MLFHNDGNMLKDCKRHFLLDISVDKVQLVADLQALLIGQDALQQCDLPRAQEPRERRDRQLLADTCAAIRTHQPRTYENFRPQRTYACLQSVKTSVNQGTLLALNLMCCLQ